MAGTAPPKESTPSSSFTTTCTAATAPTTSTAASTILPNGPRKLFHPLSRTLFCWPDTALLSATFTQRSTDYSGREGLLPYSAECVEGKFCELLRFVNILLASPVGRSGKSCTF